MMTISSKELTSIILLLRWQLACEVRRLHVLLPRTSSKLWNTIAMVLLISELYALAIAWEIR